MKLILLLLPWLISASPLLGRSSKSQADSENIANANHIFNAIHSSARQFGSSLNHNGMSLFIAHVPAGIELYHGTHTSYRINETEWLAFEPEHAMLFSRPRGVRPPEERPGRGEPPEDGHGALDEHAEELISCRRSNSLNNAQAPFTSDTEPPPEADYPGGWLHTYRTKHNLRLLYVDGQSAAKSTKGTLDVQDFILLNGSAPSGPIFGDFQRAADMCKVAHEEWDDKIDGIVRMEGGFEIILCSFAKHLDVVRIINPDIWTGGPAMGQSWGDTWNYYKAVAARYDGIGENRIRLDYESFVTVFAHPDAMYIDDTGRPRVRNDSSELGVIRDAVTQMVMQDSKVLTTDWQAVVDMYVARYADRLEYMASGDLKTKAFLQSAIHQAIRPFVDYSNRNSTQEIRSCALQFWPHDFNDSTTAARAVKQVVSHLCSSLVSAAAMESYDAIVTAIRELKEYLAWITWKRCRGCTYSEICFLPIWPLGSAEDFEQPKCRSNFSRDTGRGTGYWNDFGHAGLEETISET